jgi:diguanylate cyclase (GGDEF)-like protein/PAS domain S-box-containing protein
MTERLEKGACAFYGPKDHVKIKKPEKLRFKSPAEKSAWAQKILGDIDALKIIMNWGQDKIYFKDRQSRFIFVSKGQAKDFGARKADDLVGTTDFDHFSMEHASQAYRDEKRIIKTGQPIIEIVEKETWPDGTVNWVSSSKYPLRNRQGRIIGTWGISRDVSALKNAEDALEKLNLRLKQANQQLALLSKTDSLSGLFNRRTLYDTLKREFKLRSRAQDQGCGQEFCLILFDIDHFKSINDTMGHLAGDKIIREIAVLLRSGIRSTDSLFRYGGDEFLLLLPGTCLDNGRFVANKLLQTVRHETFVVADRKMKLTVSAGVSCSEECRTANGLLKKADQRLYKSKKSGRDRVT